MTNTSGHEFGRLRRVLWPVHRNELRKLIPMLLMSFCIGFIYHILRNVKDSLLVTAGGAEVIPFVKVWAMLPMAILLTSIFVKLSHRYSTDKVFYMVVGGFLSFYALFALILYPSRDLIHPHGVADYLQVHLPQGLGGAIAMFRYWSFTLFYVISELWGTIVLTVLFWGFANEVTSVPEAARFYGIIGLGANMASIMSGSVAYLLCHREFNPSWIIGEDVWHQSLLLLTVAILLSGVLLVGIFRWFNANVVQTKEVDSAAFDKQVAKVRSKGSIRENIRFLAKSKYLIMIAVVVLSYNVVINLTEVLWKHQLQQLYPDSNSYNIYMSHITMVTGILSTILGLFACNNLVRRFGWTVTALVTPGILVITSIAFFGFYFMSPDKLVPLTTLLGLSPLALVTLVGSIQNCCSRACKYTLFDETKEMSFIPLARDSRIKGKAAIDGVGSRMGKSGGSFAYTGLLIACGSLSGTAPFVGVIMVGILSGWIVAVRGLGVRFAQLVHKRGRTPKVVPAPQATAAVAPDVPFTESTSA